MNYIHGEDRNQMRIESLESFASPDSEVRVIDKIVDAMDIESLGFKLGNNKDSGRPKFDPKDLLKLYIYGYFNGIRYNNICELDNYEKMILEGEKPIEWEEKLSIKDEIEESIFLGLRMNEGIQISDFKEKYNFDFEKEYKNEIEKLSKMELIEIDNNLMKLTQKGREISNSVFVEFIK